LNIAPDQLPRQLSTQLLPAYLITSEEPLLASEACDAVRSAARDAGFSERDVHVASRGFDWTTLATSGQNLSLFAERRIVDLRLPTGKPGTEGSKAIVELLATMDDDTLLLVSAPKLDKKTLSSKWVKAIDKVGGVVRCWPPDAAKLPGWIEGRMRRAGLSAPRDALAEMARRVEGNLLAAQQEIDKLALLHGAGAVTADDMAAAVADSSRFDVFKLADAALSGNAPRALNILGSLEREGVSPVLICWVLAREVRSMAGMRESISGRNGVDAAISKYRVWGSRKDVVRACLQRHSTASLFALLELAAHADLAAKGQVAANPWDVLLDLVVGLAGQPEPVAA
jgi:DNA polymerase-3 subunit delta